MSDIPTSKLCDIYEPVPLILDEGEKLETCTHDDNTNDMISRYIHVTFCEILTFGRTELYTRSRSGGFPSGTGVRDRG